MPRWLMPVLYCLLVAWTFMLSSVDGVFIHQQDHAVMYVVLLALFGIFSLISTRFLSAALRHKHKTSLGFDKFFSIAAAIAVGGVVMRYDSLACINAIVMFGGNAGWLLQKTPGFTDTKSLPVLACLLAVLATAIAPFL